MPTGFLLLLCKLKHTQNFHINEYYSKLKKVETQKRKKILVKAFLCLNFLITSQKPTTHRVI